MSERYPEPVWGTFNLFSGDHSEKLRLDMRHVVAAVERQRRTIAGAYVDVTMLRLFDGKEFEVWGHGVTLLPAAEGNV